ncbi:MAG: DUF1573 domain-containing protein [Candidatus Nanoarchaeia archaeon]
MAKHRCKECDREFKSGDALCMHNRSKHPETSKGKMSGRQREKTRNYAVLIIAVLVLSGLYYWNSIPPENAPIIDILPRVHNFGTVSQAGGAVSTEMTIYNKGASELILTGMDSSCGCTSAAVVHNGIEGPRFSMAMHGTNPKDWKQVIPPGESVQLKVYYDPNVHKELRGAVTRTVAVFSNDPMHKKAEVTIKANQVD